MPTPSPALLQPGLSLAPSRATCPDPTRGPQRRRVACLALGLAVILWVAGHGTSPAGPVILGGDDLPLHGYNIGSGNNQGWLYIEKALTKMFQSGCITRPNDGSIAALGVSDPGGSPPTGQFPGSGGDGGSAIHFAGNVALGKTINYYNGATGPGSVTQFFADLAANTAKPAMIWICSGYGDLGNEVQLAELQVINANALALANFVNTGGGLMAHTALQDFSNFPATYNQWLPTLIPGLNEVSLCNSSGATLTAAGIAAFPGLSNSDIDGTAGPCHTHFQGPIGPLQVLVYDGDSPPNMYIIGGDCGTKLCDQCDSPPDTCCAGVPTFSADEHPPFSTNLMVGTREAFGPWPYCVTVFDLGSSPPSPLEDKDWASILRYQGPANSWNVDSLGSVFGLTVDDNGNIFVTHTSCYSFDAIAMVFGGAPGAIYRLDAITGKITTFCVLPNIPDPGIAPGSNWPGLGNITFDCRHKQFFVTNHEDGRIYRVKPTAPNAPAGTIVQTFDPLGADNNQPGWAPLGEALWGVQWHGDRVYYSVWVEDVGTPNPSAQNEIRSVGLFPSGAIDPSSDRHELWVPPYPGQTYSNPVSDISFSASGKILLGERGITNSSYSSPHKARALEYYCAGGCWLAANTYLVGPPGPGTDCAGGVDYDRYPYTAGVLGRVWASADLMHNFGSYSDVLSGYQGLRPTGGSHLTSLLVDSDGNPTTTEKTFIGDVEVVGCPGPFGTVCGRKFNDLNHNGVRNGGEPYLAGWTVVLTGTGGTFTTTTDGNGNYCFQNVPPGTYTLFEQLQPGWVQTAPAGSTYPMTVAASQVITGLDFGNHTCGSGGGGCATPPPGMVAWWPFDETAGSTTAADLTHQSPAKNVAQLVGGAAITNSGHVGRMLCVPGELDYAKVPNANQMGLSFPAGSSFAIDAWVNMAAGAGAPRTLVEKRVPTGANIRGWTLYFNGLQLHLKIGIGIATQTVPGPTVTAGSWQHVAVSVDRSGPGRWYLNGTLVPTFNFTPITGYMGSAADLYIGQMSPAFGIGAGFDGCIDDLEIFNAPLSAASVLTLYTAGAAGKCADIVRLPTETTICSGRDSVIVCFNICNTSAVPQSYHWSAAGMPAGAGCTVNGPTSIIPPTGTVTVAPGACSLPICMTIKRPIGLTAQNATACYQVTVVNDSTGACQTRQGTIRADNTCWCSNAGTNNLVNVPARLPPGMIGVPVDWGVGGPCGNGTQLPYRIMPRYEPTDHPDPQIVSLNGLPPGEPVTGLLAFDPVNDPATLEVLVSLPNGYDPAAFYEIVLEADTDGDGTYEVMDGTRIVATYEDEGVTEVPVTVEKEIIGLQAAPNPFTSGSTVRFTLARSEQVDLRVYDTSGRLVRRLTRGQLPAGTHAIEWDGRSERGRNVAAGIYFVRLRSDSRELTTKLLKLR